MSQVSRPIPKIFLAGRKRSGKTTSTNYLKRSIPGTVSLAFADPLKTACQALFLLSNDQLYDENVKEQIDPRWNVSPRKIFQRMGDLLRYGLMLVLPELRMEKGLIFTQNMYWRIQSIEALPNPPPLLIIEDGRLWDEYNFFKTLERGISIRIYRNTENSDTHSSELINFQCDSEIYNTGSIEQLHAMLDNFSDHILKSE